MPWRYNDPAEKGAWRIIIFLHKSPYLLLEVELRNIYDIYEEVEDKITSQNQQIIQRTF